MKALPLNSEQASSSRKTILLYHPSRYTGIFKDAEIMDSYLEEHVPCNFLVARTWDEFVSKLDLDPDLVGFHSTIFEQEQFRIPELVTTIFSTLKIKNKQAKVAITVTPATYKETVDQLKKTNIAGIQFSAIHYGAELAASSWRELLNNGSYWPEELISNLKINKKPLYIYFGENYLDKTTAVNYLNELTEELECTVDWCKNLDQLSNSISETPRTIAVHIDLVRRHGGSISEFMMMIETMIKYANNTVSPNIAIVIEKDTHLLTIKELQKHKILGIIPGRETFSKQEGIAAINAILSNNQYWPKHIINSLPGNEQRQKNKNNTALTSRQQEVFDLIAKRGLSNKQIARVLNITESTVKIHVSAVMKNFCVRNRTQLALTK